MLPVISDDKSGMEDFVKRSAAPTPLIKSLPWYRAACRKIRLNYSQWKATMANEKKAGYRPSWDDYFMALARILGTRSSCDRLQAGAILVKDKRIISSGYNGAPPGMPTCNEVGHLMEEGHCVRTIHAEHNAILQAAQLGSTSTKGCMMYTKYNPCIHCTKYVIAAGVTRVVVGKIYRGMEAVTFLRDAGIQVDIYKESKEWDQYLVDMFAQEVEEVRAREGDVTLKVEKKRA